MFIHTSYSCARACVALSSVFTETVYESDVTVERL